MSSSADPELDDLASRRQRLRERFLARPVSWLHEWESLLDAEPLLFAAYLDLAEATTAALEPATRELILVAINASPTHLAHDAVRHHVGAALDAGAEPAHIIEVLALVAILGMHSGTVGVPVVVDALGDHGRDLLAEPLSPEGDEVAVSFSLGNTYWQQFERDIPTFLPAMLRLDPAWMAAFLTVSGAPWQFGLLPEKVKELVYLAVDVATTHLHVPGARLHARNAIAFGASAAEVVEVLELASTIGVQSLSLGLPILRDVLEERARVAEVTP